MEDFFGSIVIELVLNFIGATIRWIYGSIWRTIFNKSKFKFKDYLNGPEENSNYYDDFGHNYNNILIGVIFIVGIIVLSINFI